MRMIPISGFGGSLRLATGLHCRRRLTDQNYAKVGPIAVSPDGSLYFAVTQNDGAVLMIHSTRDGFWFSIRYIGRHGLRVPFLDFAVGLDGTLYFSASSEGTGSRCACRWKVVGPVL
jgi:hypothetical protein